MAKQSTGRATSPFPSGVAKPAQRALASVGITRLEHCTRFTEQQLAELHGMGPRALGALRDALAAIGKSFAAPK